METSGNRSGKILFLNEVFGIVLAPSVHQKFIYDTPLFSIVYPWVSWASGRRVGQCIAPPGFLSAGAVERICTIVSLPMIRTGKVLGIIERTPQEATGEMAWAVRSFLARRPRSVKRITFVVYRDVRLKQLLAAAFLVH